MNSLYIFAGIIVLLVLYVWSLYNGLVMLKMRISEAWSQIDVQLKRRADLIPNLVETVKGYAKHEKSIMTAVTDAHKAMLGASSMASKAKASDALSGALGKLLAIAENYPQLKANDSFIQLQKELSDTEDKVAYSRQYYNSSVLEFNTKIQVFPNSLLASGLGFTGKEFFGATEADRQPTKVKFE
ncbi:MAG: LemA family protein [Candidatus Gottesmanbacteria bacterium]|nr:LemA family protein [Candidatus Gottesmanbacteria bacterium]